MIDTEIMQESIKLGELYESRWGKEVDFVGMPSSLGQHKLLLIMRLIVDTGDSILVGYQKIRDFLNPYYDYLDTFDEINNGDVVDKKCPLCNSNVRFYKTGNLYKFKCDTPNCLIHDAREI